MFMLLTLVLFAVTIALFFLNFLKIDSSIIGFTGTEASSGFDFFVLPFKMMAEKPELDGAIRHVNLALSDSFGSVKLVGWLSLISLIAAAATVVLILLRFGKITNNSGIAKITAIVSALCLAVAMFVIFSLNKALYVKEVLTIGRTASTLIFLPLITAAGGTATAVLTK